MRSRPSTSTTDAVAPGRRRRGGLRALAVVVAVIGVAYLALLVVAPTLSRPKVARAGLRLYRCEALGGELPVVLRAQVGLDREHDIASFTSVRDGDRVYVAGAVTDAAGSDLGAAVWTAPWSSGGAARPIRAANDLARAVAANPGGSDPDPSSGLVDAAAHCTTKR